MATPEGKVKLKIDKWIKANLPNAYVLKPQGGSFGKNGEPDYSIVYLGTSVKIEVKADESCRLTDLQKLRLKQHTTAGGISAALLGFQEHKLVQIKRMCEIRFELMRDAIESP